MTLAGVHALDITGCRLIIGSSFKFVSGIHTLIACYSGVVDESLMYLAGIHSLDVASTFVSDAGVAHLASVHSLDIRLCKPVKGSSFQYLQQLQRLDASNTYQLLNRHWLIWTGLALSE